MIAIRGGKAALKAPLVIEHREARIYLLCEAAELIDVPFVKLNDRYRPLG